MKKIFLPVFVGCVLLSGCVDSYSYNDMTDSEDKWIMEQYEKGLITKDQARELMFQRLNNDRE